MAINYKINPDKFNLRSCFKSVQSINLDNNSETKEWLVASDVKCPITISDIGDDIWIIISEKDSNKVVLNESVFNTSIAIVSYEGFKYGKDFLHHVMTRGPIKGARCYTSSWFWEWDNHLKTYIKKLEVEKEHDEYCESEP